MKVLKNVCVASILIGILSGEWIRIQGPPKVTVNDISIGYDTLTTNLQRIYFVD